MTPSGSPRHDFAAALLLNHLSAAALPSGFAAMADVDVLGPQRRRSPRPDVLVVSRAVAESTALPIVERPAVVVEILSLSSTGRDFVTKLRTAEVAGVPEYWVVNPETHEIVRHTLVEGRYDVHLVEPGQEEKVETLPLAHTLRPDVLGTPSMRAGRPLSRTLIPAIKESA